MANQDLQRPSELLTESSGTYGGLAAALAQALKLYGLDYKPFFVNNGLAADVEQCFNCRISKERIIRLIQNCVSVTGDDAFPLVVGKQIQPTMLHYIGISSLASECLSDILDRLHRFQSLVSDDFMVVAQRGDTTTKILVRENVDTNLGNHGSTLLVKDSILATALRSIRIVLDPEFVPEAVLTERNPLDAVKTQYLQYFGCPIQYEADCVALVISNKDMDAKLPGANPELARFYDNASLGQLADLKNDNLTIKVEFLIISHLERGAVSKEFIADLLHMSPRNLQKKLEKEKTSFKEIFESVRCRLAIMLLKNESKTVGAVAVFLGYSNTANFSRAFKKWTGTSPANYLSMR
ncbi:hypothetical protein A9Q99_00575 [Gammaproteobacteria bacterium 45_16_T64]|nr:hypothetical protein A9Q99_00575 [Gammaproteobacteria bacterium 45_16_T64]